MTNFRGPHSPGLSLGVQARAAAGSAHGSAVGKRTLTDGLQVETKHGLQRRAEGADIGAKQIHASAQRGIATPSTPLPHADRIQRLFGRHDISKIQAHTDGAAAASARSMGAAAYATGNHVVLSEGADLHTIAHEAAHVVQQRGGVQLKDGVGTVGDAYERHADAVADLVVEGKSAESLLDHHAATSAPSFTAGPVQCVKAYRVQDNDEKRKRMDIKTDGSVEIYQPPLNISIGEPDHALYYLKERKDYDVIKFDIADNFYEAYLRQGLSPQDGGDTDESTTFNDVTTPGFKIEIKDSKLIDHLKGTNPFDKDKDEKDKTKTITKAKAIPGNEFSFKKADKSNSEAAITRLLQMIYKLRDHKARTQAHKKLADEGLSFTDGALAGELKSVNDVTQLKARLWEIHNTFLERELRNPAPGPAAGAPAAGAPAGNKKGKKAKKGKK